MHKSMHSGTRFNCAPLGQLPGPRLCDLLLASPGSAFASACYDASSGDAPCLGIGVTTSSGSTLCLPGGNCSCTDTILADASPIVTASLCNSQQVNQGGWESMCTVPVDSSGVYDLSLIHI